MTNAPARRRGPSPLQRFQQEQEEYQQNRKQYADSHLQEAARSLAQATGFLQEDPEVLTHIEAAVASLDAASERLWREDVHYEPDGGDDGD